MSPRRRLLGSASLLVICALTVLVVLLAQRTGGGTRGARRHVAAPVRPPTPTPPVRPAQFAVGRRDIDVVDPTRVIRLADGTTERRAFAVEVRYPAAAASAAGGRAGAPARAFGPFPLIVFGHGFDVRPSLYARLLEAWARAGYVVAAPVFPRENPDAPGGPDEADLVNQPGDMSLVITRMIAASQAATNPLHGMVDPTRIVVAGQSDGGDTALAVAYDQRYRDPRVRAAMILSGAEIPFIAGFTLPPGAPPLLATQGSADAVNPPSVTAAFFDSASSPKFLLTLIGADHLPPYSYEQPQLGIVERVSLAFLARYLDHGSVNALVAAGTVPGIARLTSVP